LHIYVFFFGFDFLFLFCERHALIALAAVTLHDAMQLVRLSKPRSGAKYSAASGLPPGATNYITADGAKRLREELQNLRAANANSERIIGSEHHLQVQAFSTPNVSRSSARADQFQDGVRCI